jgi:AbiV family abortive infection protein
MKGFLLSDLHALRLTIYENAEALHREANLLMQHGMYSRAYLLAHFCVEELGKIPILISIVGRLEEDNVIEWKEINKRLSNHMEKIGMQNGHFYAFGLEADQVGDANIQWLVDANRAVPRLYEKKNLSTYVDARDGKISRPDESITQRDAADIIAYAGKSLLGHARAECLTNPLVYKSVESGLGEDEAFLLARKQARSAGR